MAHANPMDGNAPIDQGGDKKRRSIVNTRAGMAWNPISVAMKHLSQYSDSKGTYPWDFHGTKERNCNPNTHPPLSTIPPIQASQAVYQSVRNTLLGGFDTAAGDIASGAYNSQAPVEDTDQHFHRCATYQKHVLEGKETRRQQEVRGEAYQTCQSSHGETNNGQVLEMPSVGLVS
ncbi:hypothetical protein GX48_07448 [Paracoccidioides brasiliensis]|nr:hypothetical protein GX48_07448 [Paracoccidioides brasiliensis]